MMRVSRLPSRAGGLGLAVRWPVAEKRRIVLESLEAGASVFGRGAPSRRERQPGVCPGGSSTGDGLLGGGGLVSSGQW